MKAIFFDERANEVLVADDHKFVHRLGLVPPEKIEKEEERSVMENLCSKGITAARSGLRSLITSLTKK